MKLTISPALAIVAALLLAPIARADEKVLLPGDKAPEIKVSKWMQGNAIKSYKKGTVYVVEFWATWCPPCIKSIPHVNELSIKYKGKAEFVGVSIWEDKIDLESRTAKFMKDMGKDMTYRVAMDAADDFMATNWMEASYSDGIPTAFIVNQDGMVAWIGHPMEMDGPLQQIISKKFDIKASRAEYQMYIDNAKADVEALAMIDLASEMYIEGKKTEALQILDDLSKKEGGISVESKKRKLELLAKDDQPAAKLYMAELAGRDLSDKLIVAIFSIGNAVEQNGNRDLALFASNAVINNMKTDVPVLLYYCAPAFSATKDHKRALEILERAIKAIDSDKDASDKQMVELRDEIVKAIEKEKAEIGK